MAIKFPCPNCGKTLSVKEQLAGKRGACSGCKKVITIPFPVAQAHHQDVEALAREAFAEAKAPEQPVEIKFIEFDCPMCVEHVKLPSDLEGKQAQCPECRRIIKVPLQVKNEPKDWRTVKKGGPAGAKQSAEPAPEGAWGSTAVAGVSREALLETGAIELEEDPEERRVRLIRYTLGGIGLVTAAFVFFGVMSFLASGKADQYLDRALEPAKSDKTVTAEQAATVHWAAAEYRLRSGLPDAAARANEEYGQARGALAKSPSLEHDAMLLNLAPAQIDLGGDKADVDKGKRLDWGRTLESVRQTLEQVRSPEAKEEAVRVVTRKLAGRGQFPAVQSLAGRLGGTAAGPGAKSASIAEGGKELAAVAAIELLSAGRKEDAMKLAESALAPPPPTKDKTPPQLPVRPALAALAILLGRDEPKPRMSGNKGEERPNGEDLEHLALGRVMAAARRGDLAAAREILGGLRPAVRLRGLAAVAALRLESDPSGTDELVAALDLAATEAQSQGTSAWLLYRIAELAAQAGLEDRAMELANRIPDLGLKGQAQLAVFRARLRAVQGPADEDLARIVAGDTGASAQALQALARHNAARTRSMIKTVEGWKEGEKAVGLAGVALGMQDKKK